MTGFGVAGVNLALIGSLALPTAGLAQDTHTEVAQAYVDRLQATQAETASMGDIDRLLVLYDDEFVYEHPRVGIRIEGKDAMRQGMANFLGQTRRPSIDIVRRSLGDDVVILELSLTFETRQADGWSPARRRQITVLELRGGRIARIIDYW